MKKSLILLGMLSIGYTYAQTDPYEGNIGINTETPQGTLDIHPNEDNVRVTATTNQGIIAPRLSKNRIANIADANLVEGTLVYATDVNYTGTNKKVVKITEKGYYFYNGTEWVNAGYSAERSKWTNDISNSLVKLTNFSDASTERGDDKNILINDNGVLMIGKPQTEYDDLDNYHKRRKLILTGGDAYFKNTQNQVSTKVEIDANQGYYSYLRLLKDNIKRWDIGANNIVETDSNTGSDFYISSASNDGASNQIRLLIKRDNGNVGIGFNRQNPTLTEKLEVNGNVRINGLKGTGSRPVFANADGVLTTGGSSAIQVGNTDNITCTLANAGTMNYKEVTRNGQQIGVFGFCIRRGNDYVWAYMAGGSNIFGTSADGAEFGAGL